MIKTNRYSLPRLILASLTYLASGCSGAGFDSNLQSQRHQQRTAYQASDAIANSTHFNFNPIGVAIWIGLQFVGDDPLSVLFDDAGLADDQEILRMSPAEKAGFHTLRAEKAMEKIIELSDVKKQKLNSEAIGVANSGLPSDTRERNFEKLQEDLERIDSEVAEEADKIYRDLEARVKDLEADVKNQHTHAIMQQIKNRKSEEK